jgi:hypothetical protein
MAQSKDKDPTRPEGERPQAKTHELPESGKVEYRPNPRVHLAESGTVVLDNWVGSIGAISVRVYYGAQIASMPEAVVKGLRAAGVNIGKITYAELGLRPRGARGSVLVENDRGNGGF